ncbi:MAG TPA: vanadium-dependent haloperoxidase [Streptosporangiaceae bacterium]
MLRSRAMLSALAGAALAAGVATPAWADPPRAGGPAGMGANATVAGPFTRGSGRLVADWNKTLISILGKPGAQPAAIHPTRSFAILQAAEYDAVVSVTRAGRSYLLRIPVFRPADAAAAADQAAHDVLTMLYPGQAGIADSQLATELAAIPDGPARQRGAEVGKAVAARLLAIRSTDGSAAPPPSFVPGTAPGDYQPTPPGFATPVFTGWGNVTPFVLNKGAQFRPVPPPPVMSGAYKASLAVTKSLGQDTSTTRTADQTAAGKDWSSTPVWNVWNEVAQDQVIAHDASLAAATAMFAALDLTLADSAIGLYDAKYVYRIWRPITAIRGGAEFGFPPDPDWNPLTTTAPDPSYPGAHATFSFAAATILTAVFGGRQPVTVHFDALPGQTRGFASFSAAASEASLSRIWAGQHTMIDENAGQSLGSHIAWFILRHFGPLPLMRG